jgi:NAD+ kinase
MNHALLISKDRDDFYQQVWRNLSVLGIKVVTDHAQADFSIVLGGDGTVLSAARQGLKSPVVVINTGHLGFLTSSNREEAINTLDRVLLGEFTVNTRHLLTVSVAGDVTYLGLNDVVVRPNTPTRLARLALYASEDDTDELLIADYRADGLIISTPTGSTAYSLSAGGPIIHPSCRAFVVTPICPQGLTQRPIVLPHTTKLRIEPLEDDLFVTVDGQVGQTLDRHSSAQIAYNSHSIQTVNPIATYYQVLQTKLGWGIRPTK